MRGLIVRTVGRRRGRRWTAARRARRVPPVQQSRLVIAMVAVVGAPRRSAPRSPPRGCSRRGSARRRSSGRTRSRPCSSRSASATGSAAGSPTATRRCAGCARLVLLAAAPAGALVPFVAGPFLRVSVDALDRVEAGAFVGSLVGVLVLIAAPVLLLGAVAPYAVRLSVAAVDEAGRVAGRLYAISTLGSLAGVFLSALRADPAASGRAARSSSSRSRSRSSRRRARRAAGSLVPAAARAAAARARRDGQGGRRGEGRLGARDGVPVRARRRGPPTASAGSSSTRARRSTRSTARALADRQLLGRGARPAVRRPRGARRARSRSSATPPAPTARAYGHYFPRRASTPSRSTAS